MKFFVLFLAICNAAFLNAQSVSTVKSVYAPGEAIQVNFSGFQGNASDWIGIATKGLADDKYTIWKYTGGNISGTLTFDGLPYGEYEVRGYFNNGSTVIARAQLKVGNVDQNTIAKTQKAGYKPYEKILVHYSGLPGNKSDWVSISEAGSNDDKYVYWFYTDGKQSGTMEFTGVPEGKYEVRTYFNGESTVRTRSPFVVNTTATGHRVCRTELSTFYAGMNSFGLAWGRLGSDAFVPVMITDVQATLGNVIAGINAIGCLDFQVSKISSFSSRLPGLTRESAVNEIDVLIKELQGSVNRARITCDKGAILEQLFITGIHLGAAQAIANTFMCMTIPMDWQGNLRNHLSLVTTGITGFGPCIPGVSSGLPATVPVGAANAYEPFSIIVGIHQQVLWSVSLSDCCCACP